MVPEAPWPLPAGIYILIAVGAVMMFVGFLGCYGAIQESQCLLGTVGPAGRTRGLGVVCGRSGVGLALGGRLQQLRDLPQSAGVHLAAWSCHATMVGGCCVQDPSPSSEVAVFCL